MSSALLHGSHPPHPSQPLPCPATSAFADLKQALAAAGVASEFYAGALYCAGSVVIKRRGAGEDGGPGGGGGGAGGGGGLVVEGALSDDYYRIREVVYAQMHIC